ncbi:DNA mismatch repair protein MutT [Marinomonas sp. S3726]|uniref:nucleotide triphosphate diphosphatase NUDT15 n=1 Tax=Marinomonas sp. S3726 TaxID=579484 RepID=UPI0005F9FF69|nr:NUDIX hydrolase [Marinomonas sp. S3726]KJZ15006.1 DNA mismatch repair protein MutT [Marinomonas sp. S3726]
MEDNKQIQVGIGVILVKEGKVLLGQRIGAYGANTWGLPGGHLEYGETFEDCAIRETFEETNLTISGLTNVGVTNDLFADVGKHYVTLFLQAEQISGELKLAEPEKCLTWQWFDWQDLPKPLFPSLANFIKQGFEIAP